MLIVLILGVLIAIGLGVMLLQRNQSRRAPRARYFRHTLGVNDPASRPVQAEDETPAR
jgi:hypothetical protein